MWRFVSPAKNRRNPYSNLTICTGISLRLAIAKPGRYVSATFFSHSVIQKQVGFFSVLYYNRFGME